MILFNWHRWKWNLHVVVLNFGVAVLIMLAGVLTNLKEKTKCLHLTIMGLNAFCAVLSFFVSGLLFHSNP